MVDQALISGFDLFERACSAAMAFEDLPCEGGRAPLGRQPIAPAAPRRVPDGQPGVRGRIPRSVLRKNGAAAERMEGQTAAAGATGR